MTDSREPRTDNPQPSAPSVPETTASLAGTVLRAQGGIYEVETPSGVVSAVLRGKLKREPRGTRASSEQRRARERPESPDRRDDRVAVGDRVVVERAGEDERAPWAIEEVEERRTALVRRAPGKAPRGKTIIANVEQILIVFAVTQPEPHLRMLDRFLVLCEASGLSAVIVANKTDLAPIEEAKAIFGRYEEIGYPVIYAASKKGIGVEEVRKRLCGHTSALTGPSGVGKSSLLNAVQPGLALRVASISDAVQKGRHTTVTAQLIPLECGGYVADTPGLREVGLWGIDPEELDHYFVEFRPYLEHCRFGSSCTHSHEPDCAVREAVLAGKINPERYESYLRMLLGDEEEP
jgi:ribosome biogenesis GTPase